MKSLSFTKKQKRAEAESKDVWREEKDAQGTWKVKEQRNGVKVRLLREPSPEYKAKMKARREADAKREAEKKVERDREKLIQDKIRELAIKQLEKEGKL